LDKREFSRQRDELQKEIFNALLAYRVYFEVWPTEKAVDVINRYKNFFQPVRYALHYTWIMGLAKIFDKDTRTISLINLLDVVSNNELELVPNCSHGGILELKDLVKQHDDTLDKIKNLRDQYFAHHDKNPKSKLGITKGEIDKLAETIRKVFNRLSAAHDKNIFSWSFQEDSSSRTTTEILEVLKAEMTRQKRRFAKIIRDTRNLESR